MKKYGSILLATMLFLLWLVPCMPVAAAQTGTYDGLTYSISDGVAVITGYDKSVDETLVIPSFIEGCPVVTIGYEAFLECFVTSVTIPDCVTTIGKGAFKDCARLRGVTIGSGVTSIGDEAFSGCDNLYKIAIPDNVTAVGKEAFYFCTALETVTIGNGVTTLQPQTFDSCFQLSSVTIGDGVTAIENSAFRSCSKLTSLTLPLQVKTIGEDAFEGCARLTDVYYGGTATDRDNIAIHQFGNEPLIKTTWHYTEPTATEENLSSPLPWILTALGGAVVGGGIVLLLMRRKRNG